MNAIYQIINKINEHCYIGSTVNFTKRTYWHKSRLRKNKHHSPYLQRAWNKYGEDAFEFRIIEMPVSDLPLLEVEQRYLTDLKPEYNVSEIAGGGDLGPAVREKLSIASRGNKANLGKKFSEEHKRKIGESNKGKRIGCRASNETKLKMRTARLAYLSRTKEIN